MFMQKFKDWASAPYRGDMSALDWFLFTGLIIIAIIGWRFILAHLRGVVAAVTD